MRNITVIERFKENEELAEKFHQVESSILSVLNYVDFFQTLLAEISELFEVPQVWFSIIDKHQATDLARQACRNSKLRKKVNLIDKGRFETLLGAGQKPLLINENLSPYYQLLPAGVEPRFKSLAMVPVTLDGDLIGSLNLADSTAGRYQPGFNTIHLERLAFKVSLCLSNVTAHERLQHMAYHDPLTDLFNRRAMEHNLKREFSRARRYNSLLSVAFIDLDQFKAVNDEYGHDYGDCLLQYVADGMKKMCRQMDFVTRLAGDEFVLLLPETDMEAATNMLQRMEDRFTAQPLEIDNHVIPVMLSFGIASSNEEVATPLELLKLADGRLYERKRQKKVNHA